MVDTNHMCRSIWLQGFQSHRQMRFTKATTKIYNNTDFYILLKVFFKRILFSKMPDEVHSVKKKYNFIFLMIFE